MESSLCRPLCIIKNMKEPKHRIWTHKRVFLRAALFMSGFIIVSFLLFHFSKSRTSQLFGGLVGRVETEEKVVALTFDDGPTEHTDDVLKILEEKNVRATFYTVGGAMERRPEQARNIVKNNHELANHSYSHQRFLLLNDMPWFVKSEIDKTNDLIRKAGYAGDITFRPPYGKKFFFLPLYLSILGMKTVLWDVEPDTYAGRRAGEERTRFLVDYAVQNVKPGSIILIHPFCETCESGRQAIGQIVDRLREKGYRFVTVTELLRLQSSRR